MSFAPTIPRLALVLAVAVAAIAGCGDDDDTTTTNGQRPAAATADKGACDELLAIDGTRIEHGKGYEQALTALADRWSALAGKTEGTTAAAAEKIAASIRSAVAAKKTGELEGSNAGASRTVHGWAYESCGLAKVDVVARDYAFSGIAPTLEAGDVAISIRNTGAKPHSLALARVNDGVDEPVEKLLADPEKLFEQIEVKGSSDPVAPGTTGYMTASLTSGRWLLVDPEFMDRGQVVEATVTPG